MNHRKYHRIVGIIMLTPLIAWALTGLVFLIQPGYGGAYEMLSPRSYSFTDKAFTDKAYTEAALPEVALTAVPLANAQTLSAAQEWSELRYLRTILGEHLLARGDQGWQHLDPRTLEEFPMPQEQAVRSLVADAIAHNPQRYGEVEAFEDGEVRTSTGVTITLDWNTLSLRQTGNDTRWIDQLYQIHYLQWTGVRMLDSVLGVAGLLLLVLMTMTGFKLVFRKS